MHHLLVDLPSTTLCSFATTLGGEDDIESPDRRGDLRTPSSESLLLSVTDERRRVKSRGSTADDESVSYSDLLKPC